jgi:hypothetical protein
MHARVCVCAYLCKYVSVRFLSLSLSLSFNKRLCSSLYLCLCAYALMGLAWMTQQPVNFAGIVVVVLASIVLISLIILSTAPGGGEGGHVHTRAHTERYTHTGRET